MVLIFALLGLVGLALAFHSPGALRSYFSHASGHVGLQQQTGGGISKVASLVLRSFLQYAIVIPWCVWLDRARPSGWRLWGSIILVGVLVAVAEATFSYNRGSIAAPLVALLAVLGARRLRLRLPVLLVIGLVAFSVLAVARTYRNSSYTIAQAVSNSKARSSLIAHTNLSREVQIYANAPQYLGYFLDREDYGAHPTYGLTVLSSILSPVSRLGTPFRTTSGPTLFNRQIYGPGSKQKDQIVPFQGELFLDFAYPGVFVGYLLLGMLAISLERGFQRGGEALRAYLGSTRDLARVSRRGVGRCRLPADDLFLLASGGAVAAREMAAAPPSAYLVARYLSDVRVSLAGDRASRRRTRKVTPAGASRRHGRALVSPA